MFRRSQLLLFNAPVVSVCIMCSISCFVLLAIVVIGQTCQSTEDGIDAKVFRRSRRDLDPDADTHQSGLQSLLRQARTDNGTLDVNEILSRNVQDPSPLQDFNISSNGLFSDISGRFTDLQLHGLKRFNVRRIAMNLSKMNLSAEMSIPKLSIVGQYHLDGSVTFLPLSGEGGFWMNLSSIQLHGHSLVHGTPEGRLAMDDVRLDSEVGDIQLHFQNLMGGGAWGSISNSILNQLSELILGELKPSLLKELSDYLKYQFNEVLFQKLPRDFMDPESSDIVDSILRQSTAFMKDSGVEPLPLPDHRETFQRKLFFVTTSGELSLSNGTLHGLSTLYRKGDVVAVFANDSIVFEADFGFENLTGGYSWTAKLFGTGPTGFIDIQVKSVEGFVKIKKHLNMGSQLELDTLHVNDIRQVWFDIRGLGTWDYVMEAVVNLITNGLKLQLADTITETVKKSVQKELDLLNIAILS